jgi:ABC-type transport system substrate-binding protein
MRRRSRQRRFIVTAILAGAFASAAYAFTAANTVPATNAGSGSGAISGYTASSVTYTLNATNPQNLDQVQLVSGGSWYSCTNASGSVTCATTSPQATAAAVNQLTVVAAQ